ncbi:MAG TPA: type I-MYXAN CRISPR-associated protein Cas5/Cmx5/DevS [Actinospica sp.]|jgi:CRISPR-associated protein Cas5t|nr:type I-MYXAN CRISPR-associated protein Cas5/Cmx5/DevS [Actinospica sp.]
MLWLYLHAPFAACRTFAAGWYRPTAGFLTPSAAYGLLLNIAGVESRLREGEEGHDGRVPTTLTRPDLPRCRIALGLPVGMEPPMVQSIYQQLHNYPVGRDAGLPPELAKGSKNNITPVRRELLAGVSAIIALEQLDDGDLEDRIVRGLRGELNAGRYGLPFVGDNSFLPDRLELRGGPLPARWYERVEAAADVPHSDLTRLTIGIDRADMSRTRSALFAPSELPGNEPSERAWAEVGPVR